MIKVHGEDIDILWNNNNDLLESGDRRFMEHVVEKDLCKVKGVVDNSAIVVATNNGGRVSSTAKSDYDFEIDK